MCTYLEAYSPKCLPRPSEKPWKQPWRGPIDYREGSFEPLFGLIITSVSAFEASLGPPFGQAQKVNSANLLVTEVSEVGSKYGGALASWWCSYSGHARRWPGTLGRHGRLLGAIAREVLWAVHDDHDERHGAPQRHQ